MHTEIFSSDQSQYCIERNNSILQSISKHGIASSQYLKERGVQVIGSRDGSTSSNVVSVNAYKVSDFVKKEKETLFDLINNQAAGILPICLERATDNTHSLETFGRSDEKLNELVNERLNNAVLFEIDPTKLLRKNELDIRKQCDFPSGEHIIMKMMPPESLSKAYVPKHLTDIFKSNLPDVPCTPLDSISSSIKLQLPSEISYLEDSHLREACGFEFGSKIVQCTAPDYENALKVRVSSLTKEDINNAYLLFHVVRLSTPSDQTFKKKSSFLDFKF